ncbi:thiaminase II [Halomonas sp. MCCC 1A17488]|uniref:Aminopyrimidine aminohydrolase n=1 Tax=Billgrantia sulfidoxydans TaxID=2733484 RepID=A0ABX7W3Q4_9GAMM|nr:MULTISPECIES: thiaminase II [Halomonas]MCE8016032.1 thiaminase II [Halomonas sp. MCCC 1A17488]MCG3239365.1 thiaminase II [Halomonas sp. MCCC 1A17488]QPP50705.1 thiaminase II [Halomonas sp. SS10-MC5]QTP54282.1 thiaminase II [Halomonas sulfidoxydans]
MGYRFTDLTDACHDDWRAYIEHGFVRRLGSGTLDEGAFRHYLQQDYLFLIHFARAYALAAYKSRTLSDLRQAHEGLKAILDVELELHVGYCREWGITEAELAALPEARATLAYTRYVLDTGNRGDLLDLHVALAPCLVGYGEIANWLNAQPDTVRGDANPYDAWIAMYASDDFQVAMRAELEWLDARLADVTPARFAELAEVFRDATRLEIDFWQMGLDHSL